MWAVLSVYAASATLSRLGLGGDVEQVTEMLEGGGTFVAFMIIFYVGYCYDRYQKQFEDCQKIMNSIVNACIEARVTFEDPEETHRLWRYLNMMHAAAYCGLTETLTQSNFFEPLCAKHQLLGDGDIRQEELASLNRIHLDESGARACNLFEVWSFEIIRSEQIRSAHFSAPIHASLQAEVNMAGDHIKKLFAYRYQVLPFIYTHLVSVSCTLYLVFNAFTKGLYFDEDAVVAFGLLLPLLGVLMTALTTFGLLEVGNTILDPFGDDPEDFALLHFVEWTACASYEAIQIERSGQRLKDRMPFYNAEELVAARKMMRGIIRPRGQPKD